MIPIRRWCFWFFLLAAFLGRVFPEALSLTALEKIRRAALIQTLQEKGIPFEEGFHFAESGGFGASVQILLKPPEGVPTKGTLVLGIPLSYQEDLRQSPRKEVLPFGVELGLAFIQQIRNQSLPLTLRVAFLGDEVSQLPEDQQKKSHRGLINLYAALEEPENTVLLYLDLAEAPQSLLIHHGTAQHIAPLSALEPLRRLCGSHKIPFSLSIWFNELYKLGLIQGHPVLQSAHEQSLNAIYVTGLKSGSPGIPQEDLESLLTDYASSLIIDTENLDYHFIIISLFHHYFFISELKTLKLFLGVMGFILALLLAAFIMYREILIQLWRIFTASIWIFPLFLCFLVLALELAGVLIRGMAKLYGFPPESRDLGWAGFKILIALLFFSASLPLWNMIKIPNKADLYGNTAFLLVILGVFLAALLDITFTPIFLGICLITLVGSALKKPIPVYICAFLIPFLGFCLLLNILAVYNRDLSLPPGSAPILGNRIAYLLLSPKIMHSLYMATFTLPFLLLFERGAALGHGDKNLCPRPRLILLLSMFTLTLGGLAVYTYQIAQKPPPVRQTLENAQAAEILQVELRSYPFLQRKSMTLSIEAKGNPLCFNLYLDTDQDTPLVIYAAPMPVEFTKDWKSAALMLGEGPPNPFTTEIVLPLDFRGSLRVEALYTDWDPSPETKDYVLQVIRRIPLSE